MHQPIASQAIEALLESFRQKSRVQASSLITTVFGDAILPRGGRVWLGSLIKLLQPLDINERLVRTTVFLADLADFARVNALYAELFDGAVAPARALAADTLAAALPGDASSCCCAWSTAARVISISQYRCAARCCSAWKLPMIWPNWRRSFR